MAKKRPARPWLRLDNAAKIFPPNSGKQDTNVFRFACELTEPVHPEHLQYALDRTLEQFPFYRSVLRRGLFWHYFEQSNLPAVVSQEHRPVCARLYDPNVKSLLFDVSYFQNRINIEVFHALSDGTGGLDFFRHMICEYLLRCHRREIEARGQLPQESALPRVFDPSTQEDSFARHYPESGGKTERTPHIRAFQEDHIPMPEGRINLLDGHVSVRGLQACAKARGVSVTIYLAAALMIAYARSMNESDLRRPVVLSIPVNLRNYFPSATARNFFSVIYVRHSFTPEELVDAREGAAPERLQGLFTRLSESMRGQFARELTTEKLSSRMHNLGRLERIPLIRAIPLFIKNFVLRIANDLAQKESSITLSNLGKVDLPPFCTPYVEGFTALTSTDGSQICICSYKDRMSLAFTSIYAKQKLPMHFLRFLSSEGLEVSVGAPPTLHTGGKTSKKAKQKE